MIPTIYEMQNACMLADAGTVFLVSLGMEHSALILPMTEVNVRWHDTEYGIGSGEGLFLQQPEWILGQWVRVKFVVYSYVENGFMKM